MCVQFSLQMDLIRQQLEFEAQQVQSVMEERFGTNDEMIQRTQVSRHMSVLQVATSALMNVRVCVGVLQIRAARLEQLEKELQEARGSQDSQLQVRHSKVCKYLTWYQTSDSIKRHHNVVTFDPFLFILYIFLF